MNTNTISLKKTNAEVKILAVNTLYEYASKMVEHEINHFKQFVGKDIFKVDGSVKAKYEHEKLMFDGVLEDGTHYNVHCWYHKGYSSFDLKIQCCVNGGSYDDKTYFCQYENLHTSLFRLEDNVLTNDIPDHSYLNTRYNINELKAKAKSIQETAELYRALQASFPYQFNEVFNIERLARN